jgi:hypothetical protein
VCASIVIEYGVSGNNSGIGNTPNVTGLVVAEYACVEPAADTKIV